MIFANHVRASLVAIAAATLLAANTVAAQPVTVNAPPFPAKVTSTNHVTIGGTFSFAPNPVPLVQNSQSGNLCSPSACYFGTVTASGNSAWKLQVRLASNSSAYSVNYIQTTVPQSQQSVNDGTSIPLNTATWVTVASGTTATAGVGVNLLFNARKSPGKNGIVPTGAQLAAVIAYRVVASP